MKKQHFVNGLIIVLALSPLAYLLLTWQSVPDTFITRFELNTSFEKIQNKSSLLTAGIILSAFSILLYFLMRNLKKIDPKVTGTTSQFSFHKLGLIICIYLVILNYFFILSAQHGWIINTRVMIAFLGLLVMLIGNYMNNLRPNYVAGIRLPWTLNDPENWRKTHLLAGKLWFAGGIVVMVAGFILPKAFLIPSLIVTIILLVIIPTIYSYNFYRHKRTLISK